MSCCAPRSNPIASLPTGLKDFLSVLSGLDPSQPISAFPFDLERRSDAYLIHVEAPGVPREQITLDIKDRHLILTLAPPEPGQRPRVHGTRQFVLSKDVACDQIRATLKDGLLTLVLPKIQPEQAPSRSIIIETEVKTEDAVA